MESLSPRPSNSPLSLSIAAAAMLLAFNCWVISQGDVPLWMQPACVGALWGCTFFAGFAAKGAIFKGTWLGISLGATFVLTANLALAKVTDIPPAECLVIMTFIVSFGWIVATRDGKSSLQTSSSETQVKHRMLNMGNYSIMDIGVLTMVVACLMHAVPRLSVHPMFFFALMLAMLMGVVASWLVSRWVYYDQWTLGMLYWMLLPILLGGATCLMLAPEGQDIQHMLGWMLSGPIAVVTSQAIVVMAMLSAHRMERLTTPNLSA